MSDGPAKTASGDAHEAHDENDVHEAQIYKAKKTKKAKKVKKASRKRESLEEDNGRTSAGPKSCHNDTSRDTHATSDAVSEGECLKKRKRVGDQLLVSTEGTSLSTGDGSQRGDGSVAKVSRKAMKKERKGNETSAKTLPALDIRLKVAGDTGHDIYDGMAATIGSQVGAVAADMLTFSSKFEHSNHGKINDRDRPRATDLTSFSQSATKGIMMGNTGKIDCVDDRSRIDQEITTITAEIEMVVGEIRIVQDQDEKRHLWNREESLRADKSKLLDERRYIINQSRDTKGIY
jgi:hypothetical protein